MYRPPGRTVSSSVLTGLITISNFAVVAGPVIFKLTLHVSRRAHRVLSELSVGGKVIVSMRSAFNRIHDRARNISIILWDNYSFYLKAFRATNAVPSRCLSAFHSQQVSADANRGWTILEIR